MRSLEVAEGSNRFVLGVAGLSLVSLDVRHGDPVEALGRYPGLIEHFQRAGSWIQQWITIRNLIQALPDAGGAEAAAVLYGALCASATAPPVAGEDHRRLPLSWNASEARWVERSSPGTATVVQAWTTLERSRSPLKRCAICSPDRRHLRLGPHRASVRAVDFSQPEEFEDIRAAVRALCDSFPPEYWRELEPDRYPDEFVKALTAAGGWRR